MLPQAAHSFAVLYRTLRGDFHYHLIFALSARHVINMAHDIVQQRSPLKHVAPVYSRFNHRCRFDLQLLKRRCLHFHYFSSFMLALYYNRGERECSTLYIMNASLSSKNI